MLKKIFLILLLILSWACVSFYLAPHTKISVNNPTDLMAYLTGAKIAKSGEIKNLYDLNTQKNYQDEVIYPVKFPNSVMAYRNPPISAFIYIPLLNVSQQTAFWIITIVNFILIQISIFLLFKYLKLNFYVCMITAIIVPFGFPTIATLFGSQFTGLFLLILSATVILLKKEKFVFAGIVVSFLFLKPHLLLAIPVLFLTIKNFKNALRFLVAVTASGFAHLLINMAVYGVNFIPNYLYFLASSENNHGGTIPVSNINIFGIFSSFVKQNQHAFVIYLFMEIAYIIYLAGIIIINKKYMNQNILTSIAILGFPLISPHTMQTDLLVFIIPILLITNELIKLDRIKKGLLMLALFFIYVILPIYGIIDRVWILTFTIIIFLASLSILKIGYEKNN